jgi:hypothetical protein
MHWICVLCGCMFLRSLTATYQVCALSLKAGQSTYKGTGAARNGRSDAGAEAIARGSSPVFSRQDKLGISCRVQVPVGSGRATHPYRVLRPGRSRGDTVHRRSVDSVSWRPQGEPCPLQCWDSVDKALVADAEGFHAPRRPHQTIRVGEAGKVRRRPQAVACRKVARIIRSGGANPRQGAGLDGSTQPGKDTHPGHVGPEP